MFKKFSKKSKVLTVILSAMSVVVLTVSAFFIFVADYYHSDVSSINAYISEYNVTKKELYDGATSYSLESNDKGFIFYPGGKVEHTAYEPLMYNLASKGITCILIKMPFNLAFFNVDAASKAKQYFPNINSWYIGGHSLGGSIASTYLEKNHEDFEGLVLLASYSMNDLKTKDIDVISIRGSEDKVLNMEHYEKYKKNLPSDLIEVIIEGGCHAYFGMYGKQDGDGNPSLSANEQISLTAKYIRDFIFKE